jgi:hypothetical protein
MPLWSFSAMWLSWPSGNSKPSIGPLSCLSYNCLAWHGMIAFPTPVLNLSGLNFPLFFPAAPPGHPPVFMGAYLLSEQRHLALVAEILVNCPSPNPVYLESQGFGAWALFSILYQGNYN